MFLLSGPLQIAFLFSVAFAILDVMNREVSIKLFAVYLIFGVFVSVYIERDVKDIMLSIIPGFFVFLLSRFTSGGIGMGDAVYLMITSLFLTLKQMIFVFFISWFMAGLVSLFLIVFGIRKALPYLMFMPLPIVLLMMEENI